MGKITLFLLLVAIFITCMSEPSMIFIDQIYNVLTSDPEIKIPVNTEKEPFWTMLSSLATIIGILVTFMSIYYLAIQVISAKKVASHQIARDWKNTWTNNKMKIAKATLTYKYAESKPEYKALLTKLQKSSKVTDPVCYTKSFGLIDEMQAAQKILSAMEELANYNKIGLLDNDIVYGLFSYNYEGYFLVLKEKLKVFREKDKTVFVNVESLYKKFYQRSRFNSLMQFSFYKFGLLNFIKSEFNDNIY